MLKELVRFEWRFHTRQPSFFAACALFFGLGFVLTATGFGANNLFVNSPYIAAETLAFASLFSVFAIAIFVSNAVLRDTEHRFEEIVFTTPIGRRNYVASRLGGVFVAAVACTALVPLGMVIATKMPFLDPARVAAFDLRVYALPYVTLVVPTLLFVTAILFAIAVRTRSALATYTASIFIYLLYMVMAAVTSSPLMAASAPGAGGASAAALLDPFGLSAFFDLTRNWTIAERNHRLIPLAGILLLNRLLSIAIAAAAAMLTYRGFRFRVLARRKERAVKRDTTPPVARDYFRAAPQSGWRATVASFVSLAKVEIAAALRSGPFLLLLAVWFGLMAVELRSELFEGEYNSASYPVTSLIVAALQQPLSILGTIIVLYYGAELLWREQRYRVAALIDTTPVRSASLVVAKWLSLMVLVATTIVVAIAAGVITQLSAGRTSFEPSLYGSLFYFALVPLAACAAATIAIHAFSPNKYAGLVLSLLFVVATRRAPLLGLEHPLWRFGTGPDVGFSAFYGFEDASRLFARLMLHWSAISIALLAAASVAWRRLREPAAARLRHVIRVASRHKLVTASIVALPLLTASLVFLATNVESTYRTRAERLDWRAAYERRYRRYANTPQPKMTALQTNVDLFPERRSVSVRGTYTLRNDSGAPIRELLVTLPRGGVVRRLSIGAPARHRDDSAYGVHTFTLATPLAPGATSTLTFALDFASDALDEQAIASNGSLLMSSSINPTLGYRRGMEIDDARERSRRGLGAASQRREGDDEAGGDEDSVDDRIAFDATISTDEGQTAITSGALVRDWAANGRRYFRYHSNAMLNRFAVASARYAFARRRVGGVEISVAYLPEHHANVPAMLDTAARTLATCSTQFAPYPHQQLKLVEVPANWEFGGFAMPDTILLPETRTFLVDSRDPRRPDLVVRRVAHETAHQWFGHQLVAANRAGGSMITESLTKYVELLVLEQVHGVDAVRQLLRLELDRYLAGRGREEREERPLAGVYNQSHVYYSKGAIVLHAIRDLIGEPALNSALRSMIDTNHGAASATTGQLMRELRAVSNDAQFGLITEWVQRMTTYDLQVARATSRRTGDRTSVTVQIVAKKFAVSPKGAETEVPLDEQLDVAIYGGDPDDSSTRLATQRVRLHSGANELTFTVNAKPAFVAVDPLVLRVDRNRFDNVKKVE